MVKYVKGDATSPCIHVGRRAIVHICNDSGGWGQGFVLAVSRRWKEPEYRYRKWAASGDEINSGKFELGNVQWVLVQNDRPARSEGSIHVANMVAQDGYGRTGRVPLSYDALGECLMKVALTVREPGWSVHMPRIGCGLAGGTWDKVGPIVEKTLEGVDVHVYDL